LANRLYPPRSAENSKRLRFRSIRSPASGITLRALLKMSMLMFSDLDRERHFLRRVANVQVRKTVTILCALFLASAFSGEAFAQSPYNLMNLFGGIMQSALTQAAISEWRKIPPEELSCMKEILQQRGVSIQSLIQQGIAPFDVRLSDVRTNCQLERKTGVGGSDTNTRQSSRTEFLGASESPYIVDGLALGAKVAFNSAVYREYECTPSDQFEGLSWCRRHVLPGLHYGPMRGTMRQRATAIEV